MRIIAGKHGGRRLMPPRGDAIRPTADRIREALFFMLGDLEGVRMIDAYAGTGAVGCEAISRGAGKVWFFDPSHEAIELIEENVHRVEGEDVAVIVQGDFHLLLDQIDEDVDLVYLDPPYASMDGGRALQTLSEFEHVRKDTLVVLEQDARTEPPVHDAFDRDETREYGSIQLTFYYRI